MVQKNEILFTLEKALFAHVSVEVKVCENHVKLIRGIYQMSHNTQHSSLRTISGQSCFLFFFFFEKKKIFARWLFTSYYFSSPPQKKPKCSQLSVVQKQGNSGPDVPIGSWQPCFFSLSFTNKNVWITTNKANKYLPVFECDPAHVVTYKPQTLQCCGGNRVPHSLCT